MISCGNGHVEMTHVVKNNFEENVIDQNSQERSKKVSSSNIVQFQ